MQRRLFLGALCLGHSVPFAHAATIPRHSPEFAVSLNNGKQLLLSQHKGKVVGLIFILTYCPHCQKAVTALSKLQQEYGPRGFQVLASAIEDMAAVAVPDFVRRFNPAFPVGFNSRNAVLDYLQHPIMNRLLMPQMAFIDRQFTIRAQYPGDDKFFGDDMEKNMRQQIEALLKDASGGSQKKSGGQRKKAG
jgi:thiol-disulfide isomerase/thioredoxin